MIDIEIYDELTPLSKYLLLSHPQWFSKLGKSMGYEVLQRLKKGVRSGHPGGSQFPKRLPLKDRQYLGYGKAWYGKLVGSKKGEPSAIGYEYKDGILKVGWSSGSAKKIGNLLETGGEKQVTKYLRKLFSAAGKPLKWSTTSTKIPARPFYDPVMKEFEPQIPKFVAKKLDDYMTKGTNFAKSNGRKRQYKVQ